MKNLKTTYDISVIIPTYNRSKLLDFTLHSLLHQTIDKDRYEVVIGDDGSSDDTRETVRKYEGKMNVKYVFQEDKGYRPASARNKAIMNASGAICLFVDSSIILHENCLQEHIKFHAQKESRRVAIGYVFGFDHDEDSEDLLMELVTPTDPESSIEKLSQHKVFHDVREPHYKKYNDKIENLPAPWFYFWTCHLSVPMKDILAVGMFDENYDGRWGVEDNDLGFRLQQSGVSICLLRTATSIHYPHGKDKDARQLEGYQNCVYFHSKFKTKETELFLDHYVNGGSLPDINELRTKQIESQYL